MNGEAPYLTALTPHHQRRYSRFLNGLGSQGVAGDPTRCAKAMSDGFQCKRKRGHGPLKAFCKPHCKPILQRIGNTGRF